MFARLLIRYLRNNGKSYKYNKCKKNYKRRGKFDKN